MKELPTLIDIDVPESKHITVCGDVHGQFYDLLNIFKLNGLPSPSNPYLFNGAPLLPAPTLSCQINTHSQRLNSGRSLCDDDREATLGLLPKLTDSIP